ncbi:hypothetical protein BpHYR1_021226 [Brachionus plicatilis]|uniref:Uncharacterized protein n=1 Tax=Brachionus plicatilis TaxID=10195 RepID=A0A3M7T304_BRAPC|nr:hypothetical protein BpHYR1_021226 [Brachionus plicatilis]
MVEIFQNIMKSSFDKNQENFFFLFNLSIYTFNHLSKKGLRLNSVPTCLRSFVSIKKFVFFRFFSFYLPQKIGNYIEKKQVLYSICNGELSLISKLKL